jgi:hypothetical protein
MQAEILIRLLVGERRAALRCPYAWICNSPFGMQVLYSIKIASRVLHLRYQRWDVQSIPKSLHMGSHW